MALVRDIEDRLIMAGFSEPDSATTEPVQPIVMLPCPFCGHDDIAVEREGSGRQSCIVACEWCGCRLESNENGDGDAWNNRDWQGMTKQFAAVGFLQGVLQGLRIGIDDERAKIIDSALTDERYFAT